MIQLGMVMDAIETLSPQKDSSLAMLLAAHQRNWHIHYFQLKDLFVRDGIAYGNSQQVTFETDLPQSYRLQIGSTVKLSELDLIFMRKDPPVNQQYLYATHILELAERAGALVVNKPQALRDANEKMFTQWFPACCPPNLVTRDKILLRAFLHEHKRIVCKPLDGMGGASVFYVQEGDLNASVIFETLTAHGQNYIMAQCYLPEIIRGDKRIILINGKPATHALCRIPATGELRGNLAAGAKGIAQPLSSRDHWICEQVGPILRDKGLIFVGLDVIGDYLTEINVTSPTGIREIDAQTGSTLCQQLLDEIEYLRAH